MVDFRRRSDDAIFFQYVPSCLLALLRHSDAVTAESVVSIHKKSMAEIWQIPFSAILFRMAFIVIEHGARA
jgi:hypothetical protein